MDPNAPEEAGYYRIKVEHVKLTEAFDAVVASTSLHHVADPAIVIDRITSNLVREGTLVVVEWAWEAFDERTARWCFRRLGPEEEAGWLHRRRDEWVDSGKEWDAYLRRWAQSEGLHQAAALLRLLDQHFYRRHLEYGPYFFPDLVESEEDEKAAIDAGQVRATRVDYAGELR